MKRIVLVVCLILACCSPDLFAKGNPKVFVYCTVKLDDPSTYYSDFERIVEFYLKQSYPCLTFKDNTYIRKRLGEEKQKQLMGTADDLPSFCNDLACDYFVHIELEPLFTDQVVASATFMHYKKVEALARYAKNGARNPAAIIDLMNEVSKTMTEKLSKYEICYYLGPVNLEVRSVTDTVKKEERQEYCNGSDQMYKKTEDIDNTTTSSWKLVRYQSGTDGNMTFSMDERIKIEEIDGCHKCSKSNREGGWTHNLETRFKIEGSGISEASIVDSKPQDDTRVELTFFSNGTYILDIKGTSKPAKGTETKKESAEGTCDNISPNSKDNPREVTIPIKAVFGPYQGKSTDKVLSHKDTKVVRIPPNGEEQTIEIDFTLTRKEN